MASVTQWLAHGKDAARAGNFRAARALFKRVLEAEPEHTEALLWLAYATPSRAESERLLRRVLELDPHNASALRGLRWLQHRPHGEGAVPSAADADDHATRAVRPLSPPPAAPRRRATPVAMLLWGALTALACALAFLGAAYFMPTETLAALMPTSETFEVPPEQIVETAEPGIVFLPTDTPPPTASPTPTDTPSPTPTPTDTPSPTPTQTPLPTNTPTPEPPPPTPTPEPSPPDTPTPQPPAEPPAAAEEAEPAAGLPEWAPAVAADEKWIDISISEQKLVAYEGATPVFEATVSTGLPQTPTRTGLFRVYWKVRYSTMRGPGYHLENVPYTQFYDGSYALHGTYWHNNFGQPMSRGCVNLRTEDAQWLFAWTGPTIPDAVGHKMATEDDPGTLVNIRP